jgi:hypothetical protein
MVLTARPADESSPSPSATDKNKSVALKNSTRSVVASQHCNESLIVSLATQQSCHCHLLLPQLHHQARERERERVDHNGGIGLLLKKSLEQLKSTPQRRSRSGSPKAGNRRIQSPPTIRQLDGGCNNCNDESGSAMVISPCRNRYSRFID